MDSCDLAEFIRETKIVLWFRMSRTVILCNLQNVSFENKMVRESQFFTALSNYIYIYMHSCDLAEFIREAKNVLWFRMSRTVILCSLQNVSFENERVRESQFFTALNDYIYISLVILLSCIIAWPTSRKRCFFVCACFEFYLGVFLICSWLLLHLFKVIFTNCSASAGLTGHTIELLVVCVCVCACVRVCVRARTHMRVCVCVHCITRMNMLIVEHPHPWDTTDFFNFYSLICKHCKHFMRQILYLLTSHLVSWSHRSVCHRSS